MQTLNSLPRKKAKAKGEKPNIVQEWPQLADACAVLLGK
jgi:hypothetical protein